MPWTVPFQVKAFQSSQPHLGLIGISGLTLPRENVCLERLNDLTPRITYHDIGVLETLSLVRFVKLRNSSSRNSLNPRHRIESSGPSSDPWTHAKPLSTGSLSYGSVSVSVQDIANLLNEFFSASFNSTFVPYYFFSYTRLKWGFSWRCSQQIWLYWSRG